MMTEKAKEEKKTPLCRRVIFIAGLALVFFAPLLIVIGCITLDEAIIFLTSGVVMMISHRMDEIVEVSIGPLKARMKEVTSEAEKAIENSKKAIQALAWFTFTKNTHDISHYHPPQEELEKIHNELVAQFKSAGFSDEEISCASRNWTEALKHLSANK